MHVWLTSPMITLGKKNPIRSIFFRVAFNDTTWSTILCTASWCIVLFGHWAQPKGDGAIWESEHHWSSSADDQGSSQYSKSQYSWVLLILWYTKYFDGSRTIDTACTTHNRRLRMSILLTLSISRCVTRYTEHCWHMTLVILHNTQYSVHR